MLPITLSITNIILLVTIVCSLAAFANHQLFDRLKFNAYRIFHNREAWRFITSAFIHVDFLHLALNMYVLFMFGNMVEREFHRMFEPGKAIVCYISLYIIGAVLSGLYSFEKHKHDLWYNAVGASGAVSAVIFAFIAIHPLSEDIRILFLPFAIPAFILGGLYLGYSYYMSRRKMDNIGHDAHFFGALFGFVFMFIIEPPLFPMFLRSIGQFVSNGIF